MRVCILGISGKLGRHMLGHCLERGHEVVGVCRHESVGKLDADRDRIELLPGRTDDAEVVERAVAGCAGVLTVLVPWGVAPEGADGYATGTARAVLEHAEPDARLVFSCGWHITRDGADRYPWRLRLTVGLFGPVARLLRFADLDDQVTAADLIFASNRRWTLVRGSDLEEGPSEGLPVWAEHVGDPRIAANRTRRTDFALFMVEALTDDSLIGRAPAISAAAR